MDTVRKAALVTGGAKRVGRAIVERLAAAGFDVAFTYLGSAGEAAALEGTLRGRGGRALAVRADLTQAPSATQAIFEAVDAEFGRLDVLVNNASLYQPGDLRATTPEMIGRVMAIHVEAPLLLAQRFEGRLRSARGHIVNMLDLLAERPWPEYLAYCASKAALWNLTLGLARELAPEVTVNGIASRMNAGSLMYWAPNDKRTLRNVGPTPTSYQVIRVTDARSPKPPPAN